MARIESTEVCLPLHLRMLPYTRPPSCLSRPLLPYGNIADVNDDGYSDVIISAYGADEAYVFYGASAFSSSVYELATLSGTDGFVISTGNDGDVIIVAGAGVRLSSKTYGNYGRN